MRLNETSVVGLAVWLVTLVPAAAWACKPVPYNAWKKTVGGVEIECADTRDTGGVSCDTLRVKPPSAPAWTMAPMGQVREYDAVPVLGAKAALLVTPNDVVVAKADGSVKHLDPLPLLTAAEKAALPPPPLCGTHSLLRLEGYEPEKGKATVEVFQREGAPLLLTVDPAMETLKRVSRCEVAPGQLAFASLLALLMMLRRRQRAAVVVRRPARAHFAGNAPLAASTSSRA